MPKYSLLVNGEQVELTVSPGERLLRVLRDTLGLTGAKEACGRGECGSCTVIADGRPVMSCITLVTRVTSVETIEGLADESQAVREAFADEGAFQCGFCTPGQIVRAVSVLRAGVEADDSVIRREMSGNICRCTGYDSIVRAVRRVVDERDEAARR